MHQSTFSSFFPGNQTSSSVGDTYAWDLFTLLKPELEADQTCFYLFIDRNHPITIDRASDDATHCMLTGLQAAARNVLRTRGMQVLYVGYPFIYIKTSTTWFAAPLYLWPVMLEPQLQGAPLWFLNKRGRSPILNPIVRDYVEQSDPFGLFDRITDPGNTHSWVTLALLFQDIQPELDVEHSMHHTLHPSPEPSFAHEMPEGVCIQFCGTIGVYPPPYTTSKATFQIPSSTILLEEPYTLGPGRLDPDQATAVQLAEQYTHTLIVGGLGTGKKHLATHLTVAGLVKGKTSLIISPDITTLQHIQSELERLRITGLEFLFKNPIEDFTLLKQLVKANPNNGKSQGSLDYKKFLAQLNQYKRTKDKLDAAYGAVRRPLLGTKKWTTLTWEYLQSSQLAGKEILAAHLIASDYHFNDAEYTHLKEAIPTAQTLFAEIQTLNHPLCQLHHSLFLHTEKTETLRQVEHKTRAFEKRVTTLLYRFLSGINLYVDTLRTALDTQYRETSLCVQDIEERMQEYTLQLGSDWHQIHPTRLTLTAMLSTRAKQIIEARTAIWERIMHLEERRLPLEKFGFKIAPPPPIQLFAELPVYIETYKKHLSDWLERRTTFVQEELLRLNSNTAHQEILPPDLIRSLEIAMDVLIEELNEAHLLDQPIAHQLLTLSKRQKLLTELQEQLETLRKNLQDLPKVYDWQRFWLPLPERTKKIVRALAHLKPPHWKAAFESWYLDQVLFMRQHLELPRETLTFEEFQKNLHLIQEVLPEYIQLQWKSRQASGIQNFSRTVNGKHAPRLIPYDALLKVYPVILATLDNAATLLQELPDLPFDQVLFLHAENIPAANGIPLLNLGTCVRVFGDAWPTMETCSGSLLHTLASEKWSTTTLSYTHHLYGSHPVQLKHPEKITDRASETASTAQLVFANGTFNSDNQTNIAEAEQIVEYLLHQLPESANRTYPVTAVVASTPAQRDLIARLLLEIKRNGGEEAERIQQLERNGSGVYALYEIHHLKAEVLLASCTWSTPQDAIGAAQYVTAMYHLLGIAASASVYFHSFSSETLHILSETGTAQPLGFLANALLLLHFANDATLQQHILNRFRESPHQPDLAETNHSLLEYIAGALRPYLSHTAMLPDYTLAHLKLPLYLPDGIKAGSPVCIYLDGFLAQTPATDYCWELEQNRRYAAYGIQLIPTWSVYWWKQPDQEPRRLAAQLLRPKP